MDKDHLIELISNSLLYESKDSESNKNLSDFKNYLESYDSSVIKVCGAILDIKERSNKDGKKYAFITVSETSFQFELTIFSENLYKYRPLLKEGNLLIFNIDVVKSNTDTRFIIRSLASLEKTFVKNNYKFNIYTNFKNMDELKDNIFIKKGINGNIFNKNFKNDIELFNRWKEGRTGQDFIDANMIELNKTGFMSNRGRQNVASYLVNNLDLNWVLGASYFEKHLTDYDVTSNWCNWMYISGVGNNVKNWVFNPIRQSEMYDKDGFYREIWLNKKIGQQNIQF